LAGLPAEVVLVLDEAYHEFAREDADYPDGLDFVRRGAPAVVLRTFSKVHGLAGLRVGYAIGAPEIIEAIDTIREPFNCNSLGQLAALAALEDNAHLRRTVELTCREREALASALRERHLLVLPSLGNFLFVDLKRSGAEVFRRLLAKGVIVRPLGAYKFPTALRVSIGLPEENARFLSALDQVLAEVPPA
jgi:histidinol-phosphate aminotransferase